jgi:hypothetical protein
VPVSYSSRPVIVASYCSAASVVVTTVAHIGLGVPNLYIRGSLGSDKNRIDLVS